MPLVCPWYHLQRAVLHTGPLAVLTVVPLVNHPAAFTNFCDNRREKSTLVKRDLAYSSNLFQITTGDSSIRVTTRKGKDSIWVTHLLPITQTLQPCPKGVTVTTLARTLASDAKRMMRIIVLLESIVCEKVNNMHDSIALDCTLLRIQIITVEKPSCEALLRRIGASRFKF